MRIVKVRPIGLLARLGDALMTPVMYLLAGTLREKPQQTHIWNIQKMPKEGVENLADQRQARTDLLGTNAHACIDVTGREHRHLEGKFVVGRIGKVATCIEIATAGATHITTRRKSFDEFGRGDAGRCVKSGQPPDDTQSGRCAIAPGPTLVPAEVVQDGQFHGDGRRCRIAPVADESEGGERADLCPNPHPVSRGVWGDRIFLTTAYEGGRRLSLIAFRRSDGTQLWETFAPDGRTGRAHYKNGHASATPSTDGTFIYASFGSRGLAAFDFNGTLIWHKDLGDVDNYHGAAGSPLLYRNRVILYQDFDGGSFVAAFDAKTGKELWRTARRAYVGWGTPVAVRVAGRDEIIVSSQSAVTAYDPETGKELWVCDGNSFEVIPTPVVGHGLVFASSGCVGPTLAIRPGGRGNVTRTHLVWTSPKGSPFVPSPIVYGDQLYMVNDMASIATSFEAATGKVLWQGRLGVAQREGFSASPVAVDGKIFFTNDQGETFVLRAGPTFDLLHINRIGERMSGRLDLEDAMAVRDS